VTNKDNGVEMSNVINLPTGKLIGIKTSIFTIFNQEKYDSTAIPSAWRKFFSAVGETPFANATTFYGASIPSMSMDVPMDYFAGAIVEDSVLVPAGFEAITIPSGKYLCHIHSGPITEIAASYQKAYMESLPNSGLEMRPAPHLEIYNPQLNPMAEDYQMTIAIPCL
jgi:predicted transcriptional regulator YdeE